MLSVKDLSEEQLEDLAYEMAHRQLRQLGVRAIGSSTMDGLAEKIKGELLSGELKPTHVPKRRKYDGLKTNVPADKLHPGVLIVSFGPKKYRALLTDWNGVILLSSKEAKEKGLAIEWGRDMIRLSRLPSKLDGPGGFMFYLSYENAAGVPFASSPIFTSATSRDQVLQVVQRLAPTLELKEATQTKQARIRRAPWNT